MKLLPTKVLAFTLFVTLGIGISIDKSWAGGGRKTELDAGGRGGKPKRILPQLMKVTYPAEASIHIHPAKSIEDTLENLDNLLANQSSQPPEEWATDAIAVSLQFYELGGYDQGIEIIQKTNRDVPLSGDAFWSSRVFEAWGLWKSKNQNKAFSIYEEIFRAPEEYHRLAPSMTLIQQTTEILALVGDSYIKNKDFHQVVDYFAKVKEISNLPRSVKELADYYFAYGLYKIGRFDIALAAYDTVLHSKPAPDIAAMTHQGKGQIYILMGERWEDAMKSFFEALAIKDWAAWHQARTFHHLALCLNHLQRNEEAVRFYKSALTIADWQQNNRLQTLLDLGSTLKTVKKPKEALIYFEEAISFPDLSPQAQRSIYMNIARNSFDIKDYQRTHEAFNQARLLGASNMSIEDTLNWARSALNYASEQKHKKQKHELYALAEDKLYKVLNSKGLTHQERLQGQLDMATALTRQDKFKEVLPYVHKALLFARTPTRARGYALFLGIQSTYILQDLWGKVEELRPKYAAYLKGDTGHLELLGTIHLKSSQDHYE